MNKKQRVEFITQTLDSLYPKTPVPLNHKNNFQLLIAVLLSAQCTDERVNKITPELFKKANNAFSMAKLNTDLIYNIIRPCGLAPKKSKAISELSKILVKSFEGKVPENIEENPKLSISQPARTAQPTHRIVFDTEYYTTGPQQSRAPDGTFKAGVEVTLISEAGSYVIVEDIDGLVGHVSRDAVQPLSEPK